MQAPDEYILAMAEDIQKLAQEVGITARTPQLRYGGFSVPGVTQLAQELSLMFGTDNGGTLTHKNRLTIQDTLPDLDTDGLVQIKAYKNLEDSTGAAAIALNITGRLVLNGVDVGGVPFNMAGLWLGAAGDIPDGWAICNGTDNSSANGGSGLNLIGSGAYPKFASTVGSSVTAASNTGSAAATGTTDSGTASLTGSTGTASPSGSCSGSVDSHTHGVGTIADSGHTHSVSGTTDGTAVTITGTTGTTDIGDSSTKTTVDANIDGATTTVAGAHPVSGVVTSSTHSHSVGTLAGSSHTHGAGSLSASSGTASLSGVTASAAPSFSGTISVASHSHSSSGITDSGHTHTFTGDSHAHTPGEPAHFDVIPIERLNA